MSVTRIAHRYAKSLLDLSVEQKKMDRVLEDVKTFNKVVKNRDFLLFIRNPIIHHDKKISIIKKLFEGHYDELTMAFLIILIKKSRENYLPEIAIEFIKQYKTLNHISTVKVTSAVKLGKDTIEKIRNKLSESIAVEKHIEIRNLVDPEMIGGFIIEFEDRVYDASLAHKLESFRRELFSENLYISQIIAR